MSPSYNVRISDVSIALAEIDQQLMIVNREIEEKVKSLQKLIYLRNDLKTSCVVMSQMIKK